MNTHRYLKAVYNGTPTSDGDGVKLTRIMGTPALNVLDPFLLLDCFESDDSADYIGGFPTHPHRGFETVTYLLNGHMRHKDSAGNEGVISPGGVQWMTAGRGVLHSEMPEQEDGLLKGFQLWINLPKSDKMTAPNYQEFSQEQIPLEQHESGTTIRVISGTTDLGTQGPVNNQYTHPTYFHVTLPKDGRLQQLLPQTDNAFVYVISGELQLAHSETLANTSQTTLSSGQIGVLSEGTILQLVSEHGADFLLLSAQPLNEPIARGGPFVMNTKAEVMQAFADYQNGTFLTTTGE